MKKELKNTFDKTYLSITYDPTHQFYYNRWRGYITAENIMEGSSTYLTVLQKDPCPRLILDIQKVVGSWHEALDWLTKEWAPQAVGSGLRWLAIVVAPGSYSVVRAEELQRRLDGVPLQIEIFPALQESKDWIASQTS